MLAERCNITINQVSKWLANKRFQKKITLTKSKTTTKEKEIKK